MNWFKGWDWNVEATMKYHGEIPWVSCAFLSLNQCDMMWSSKHKSLWIDCNNSPAWRLLPSGDIRSMIPLTLSIIFSEVRLQWGRSGIHPEVWSCAAKDGDMLPTKIGQQQQRRAVGNWNPQQLEVTNWNKHLPNKIRILQSKHISGSK